MRCEVHCPDGGGALAGVAAVAGLVFAFAAVVSVAAAVVASAAEAVALVVLAACVPALWVTWRLVRFGDRREVFRRHRAIVKVPARNLNKAVANARRVELPAGPPLRALEAARIGVTPGIVLGKVKEEVTDYDGAQVCNLR